TRPYPGIMYLLSELKQRGKKIAVVSNKFYDATRSLCSEYFGDLVDVAVGEREGIRKKPAPDLVNEAFRELGVTRDEALSAVYIGDSDVDIETARNSGLPCISVLWGFHDRDFLLVHGATTFVCSPQEILE
ncbi:MAG: HAD family hydrolase, partial [Prevotella sp.]|nr:HAD family hydrolase [Prevotella sp.]